MSFPPVFGLSSLGSPQPQSLPVGSPSVPNLSSLASMPGGIGGSGIGGGAPGLDPASLKNMGVSSSTLMLMSQINTMMASVMTGLMAFMQQVMASAAQRKANPTAPGLTPASTGSTPGGTPASGSKPGSATSAGGSTGSNPKSTGDISKDGLGTLPNGMKFNAKGVEAFKKAQEMAKKDGVTIQVNSAYRSDAEQARLYNQLKGKQAVAAPGSSTHNGSRGATGIDIQNYQQAKKYLEAAGFVWKNYSNDPWHFDYEGG